LIDIEANEIKRKWNIFFDKYNYNDKINKLRSCYPDEKSLYISYNDINDFDPEFAENLMNEPYNYLKIGEEYINENIGLYNNKTKKINIRLEDIPDTTGIKYKIKDIRVANMGKFIAITGIIKKSNEVLPRLERAAFMCPACDELTYVKEDYILKEPYMCDHCGYNKSKLKLVPEESEFVDTQKLEIQDYYDNIDDTPKPQKLTVIMEDDIVGKLCPGNMVTIYGILLGEQKRIRNIMLTEFNRYLYANNFKKETNIDKNE